MLNFFKKKEDGEKSFITGMAYGLGGMLIILIIVLAIIFGGKIKDRFAGDNTNSDTSVTKLRVTVITQEDCSNCWDVNLLFDAMKQTNIDLDIETLYTKDSKTQTLIDKYSIDLIPTVLISGDLASDPTLSQFLAATGEIIDGVFVFREVIPPYIEVETGQLRGGFSVIYLTDDSCDECYNVSAHDVALDGLGITPSDGRTVEASSDEGKQLIEKYDIKALPTILMTGDLEVYQGLAQVWPTVGDTAEDGTYIFRDLSVMGTYYDLENNKVVVVELPSDTIADTTAPSQ
ncbi:MAG TPA: hypothetical protein VJB67_02475 [Patescibacteria group bacterium]|nr:hypothetical protein [Patescibacteria group bacterium]